MERGTLGVYIGPKDSDSQADLFVKTDHTHINIYSKEIGRELELSKEAALFLNGKAAAMEEAVRKNQAVSFKHQLNTSSVLKITTSDVPREMIDIRIWFRNCVGRWTPTRKGARIHYIHLMNFIQIINEFVN